MKEITGMDYTRIVNCMWNVVIILSTCGYGDFFPVTFFGRLVGVIATMWGVFIASMVVVVVQDQLEHDPAEFKSFKMMKRLILKREVQENAIIVLQRAYILTQSMKRTPRNQNEVNICRNAYRSSLVHFGRQTSQLRSIEVAQKRM